MVSEKTQKWANLILRIGAGFVFLYMGLGQLFKGFELPFDQLIFFLPKETVLAIVGIVSVVIGALLIAGLITRIAAGVAFVLLAFWIIAALFMGFFNTMFVWMDVVLLAALFSLMVEGSIGYSVDNLIEKI